ncbi:MAG: T9SS type A sorting domain-containing protein [Flavobacteriales bacterium]|nr:T9SS type A sorting domain-containing protein [Flavobacteriales bacterium]
MKHNLQLKGIEFSRIPFNVAKASITTIFKGFHVAIFLLIVSKTDCQNWYTQVGNYNLLGTSAQTIHQIGCTMTCATMLYNGNYSVNSMNSWRTNNCGYVNGSSQCSPGYTGASLFVWATNPAGMTYSGTTSIDNNWSDLDSKLSSGKRAILQVDGGAHWVLCVGRNGPSGVAASYVIYDPGSSTQQMKKLSNFTNGSFQTAHYYSISNSCTTPSGIYHTNLTSSSIKLWWSLKKAISYNYFVRPVGQSTWWQFPNISSMPVTFTGLTPNTSYEFKVSANNYGCSSGTSSIYTFNTGSAFATDLVDEGFMVDSLLWDLVYTEPINVETYSTMVEDDINPLGVEFSYWPNPVMNGQLMQISTASQIKEVALISLLGQRTAMRLATTDEENDSFILPNNTLAGIYLLEITTPSGVGIKKLVVQ